MLGSTRTTFKNLLQFLWVLLFTFTFLVTPTYTVSFPRSARAHPKIDLREFPDTQGICRGPGFYRNETDCTQFYRCVDFDINDDRTIYTIFKFICGPMTIFDESRSVCTGPELAYPPCTDEEQLAQIFSQISTDPTSGDVFSENPSTEFPNSNIITEPTVQPVIVENPSTTTNPPEVLPNIEIDGFLVVGPTNIFDLQHQTEPFQDVKIPSYNTWGVVSHGKGSVITIQTEGTNRGSSWTLPPGAIFIMDPIQNEGIVNNITPDRVSTNSTTASFPSGANFYIILIGSRSQIIGTRSLPTTTVATKVTIPPHCITNKIKIVDDKLIRIGDWSFSTQQISKNTTTFSSFGILHKDPLSTIASTSFFEEFPPFISGILAVGHHHDNFDELNELVVNGADLVGIIPREGQGMITLRHHESTINFGVNPGSIFVILSGGSGTISNLAHESIATTPSTTIFFPAGSFIGILQIGIDGRLAQETLVEMSTGFFLSTSAGSLTGLLRLNEERVITSIGNRAFAVHQLSGSQRYFGLIDLNSIMSYSELESLQGIITLGAPSLYGAWETIDILPNTVSGIVTSGLVQITEQDSNSIKQATLNLSSGSILGISTSSTQSGKVEGVVNGFLSSPGQFTFPAGAIIGIITVRMDGTMTLENRFTTTDLTSLVVPPGSTFGTICLTDDGIVKGLGEAVFTTQYFLMNGSSVGHYGVIRYDEFHQLSQASLSSNSYNIIDPVQVIPIYDGPVSNSVPSTLSVPSGSSVAFFPAKSIGEITIISSGRSTLTIPVLPGHFMGLLNTQRLVITDLLDGFFTTQTTTISVGAGTVLGIYKMGRNGEMIPVENIGMIDDESNVFLPSGSSLGILNQDENIITDIGGAALNIIMVSSTTNPDSESLSYIGTWDIDEFLSKKSILKSTANPLSSSISGIIAIHSGSYSSISSTSVQPGKSIAILPVKEPGDIVITEKEGSEFPVKLLPGQGLLVFNTAQEKGTFTDLNDGFFSSETTVVSLPAGSSYTTFYIAEDKSLITADNIVNIASRDLNLKLPIGSIVGDLDDDNDNKFSRIGGAALIVKPVSIKSAAVDKMLVGLVDVAGYLASKPLLLKEATSNSNLLPPNKECLNHSNDESPQRSTEE